MTPEREAFYALREKNKHLWGKNGHDVIAGRAHKDLQTLSSI